MADVTVTAAEVLDAADTVSINGHAGVVIAAGQTVYLDSATNTYLLADADLSAAAAATKGIAMNSALVADQPIEVAIGGTIDPGFTVTVGKIHVQSDTAGGIKPDTDLATGDFTTIIGIGITASSIRLLMRVSGVAVP